MKLIVHPDYRRYSDFIRQLPATFDQSGELLYQGRNVVKRNRVDGQSLVVKKYNHPN